MNGGIQLKGVNVFWPEKTDKLTVHFSRYVANDSICIYLLKSGENYGVATTCVPEIPIDVNEEVIIKDYSENEGVMQAMIDSGIISKPVREAEGNFVSFPVCKLLKKPDEFKSV